MWFWSSSRILQLFVAGFVFHARVSMLLPFAPAVASAQPRQLPSQAWPMQPHTQAASESQRFCHEAWGRSIASLCVCVFIIVFVIVSSSLYYACIIHTYMILKICISINLYAIWTSVIVVLLICLGWISLERHGYCRMVRHQPVPYVWWLRKGEFERCETVWLTVDR